MSKKLPETITESVKVEKLVPGGQGIGTLASGQKIFLWNTLPGETVTRFTITKRKSKYLEAIAEEIETPSPFRVKPKDACFLSTSPWQIMSYDYELEQKLLLLREIFRQAGITSWRGDANEEGAEDKSVMQPESRSDPARNASAPSCVRVRTPTVMTDGNDFYYRNKMEYALYWNKEKEIIEPAFHMRGSHMKIPIKTSSIERPELFAKAQEIIAELNARGEEARKYQSILLRCNKNGEVSGGLYENHKPHPVFAPLEDEILGTRYSYSPNGFFQINLPVYEIVLEEIKRHISTEKVLDLYAGVGTIGLSVAGDKNLTLVEVDKSAFSELKQNAKTKKIFLSKSEEALSFVAPDQTVIVDPPRAGCDRKLLDRFLEVKPEKIIYLSCNPVTQARDLAILLDSENYRIEKIKPYNFFPRTPHLENLVILKRI